MVQANGLTPAEVRPVTLESQIDFTTSEDDTGVVSLAATALAAEQTISMTPASRTIAPNQSASYTIRIDNPAPRSVDYTLTLTGIRAGWVSLATEVTVDAGAILDVPLVLTPTASADAIGYGFVIAAETDSGAISEVAGELLKIGRAHV